MTQQLKDSQGYRRDLNLVETPNDTQALSNLAGAGIGDDLTRLQNNLRNTGTISFHEIKDGYFSFAHDINVGISSLRCIQSTRFSTTGSLENICEITIHSSRSYLIQVGDLIRIEGVTGTGTITDGQGNLTGTTTTVGTEIFHGDFSVTGINNDEDQFKCVKSGFSTSIRDQNVSGSNLIIRGRDIFTYTNDDLITFDKDVTIQVVDGATPPNEPTNFTLNEGTPYYICDSDGLKKFKISSRPSYDVLGISTFVITTGSTPPGYIGLTTSISVDDFHFIRSEPVNQSNLINFIEPDKQDPGFSYGDGTFTEQMDSTQSTNESAEYFITKKYKGSEDTVTSDDIKTEGSLTLNDPKRDMNSESVVTNYATGAGMFISGTRAFSTDNNPWTADPTNDKLVTHADEVAMGELYFGDHTNGPVITGEGFDGTHSTSELTGVKAISTGTIVASDFTHKIPVRIENADGNVETYYVLLTRNTENTSTL